MPFSLSLHCRSWLWVLLIRVHIYMMPNYNVPDSMIYHRQVSLFPKHGGAFAFSSSSRLITLYTSCKRGQNRGVTFYVTLNLKKLKNQRSDQRTVDSIGILACDYL